MCEPVVVRGGRGSSVRSDGGGGGNGEEDGEEFDVEEGKLINVCWEGRMRTRLILSW